MAWGEVMLLSSIIKTFEKSFMKQYVTALLPSHYRAIQVMKHCRTAQSPQMLLGCESCQQQTMVPHSCGHRNCPHCQAHESQQWIDRQLQKQVPAHYFLITFTLPAEFRNLAWHHQRLVFNPMIKASWQTLHTFSQNDNALKGTPGAIAVLHTHSRRLDFHPHVHVIIPAAAVDKKERLWRKKHKSKGGKSYLFSHKALAKVFRAKVLEAMTQAKLTLPTKYPKNWVVHCKSVGAGNKALAYLGRYLYRGVIQEKDIVKCEHGYVTFCYQDSTTKKKVFRRLTGEKFLWLIMQHILPKGFRRARNFGFLHPNSKRLIQVLQLVCHFSPIIALKWLRKRPNMTCRCCGGLMQIIRTRIREATLPRAELLPN